jgi:Ca-activated chloride channel homolog
MRKRALLAAILGFPVLSFTLSALACRIPDIRPWPWPPPFPPPEHPVPPPPPPRVDPMLTRLHKAEIRVEENIASVDVSATFYNPNGFRVEGTYFFPIEAEAVVKDFAMTVNGKEQKAELLEADKARQTYEDIVRKMKDPGLLEYVGTRMLKASIFPIEANAEVKVRLSYSQVARADAGVYHLRYPLLSAKPNAGKIDQMALRVSVKSATPVKLFYSPSHKIDTVRKSDDEVGGGFEETGGIPDRDFDVYWSLSRADVGVAVAAYKPKYEDGYCLISLSPKVKTADKEVQPKDIVFAFDKSGSMDGDKIKQAKSALKFCLGQLTDQDRFSVIAFSTDVDTLTEGLIPAKPDAVQKVREKVDGMEARGGTAIHDALAKAFEQLADSKRLPMIVFLTDGRPTVGPSDVNEILSAVKKANAAGKVRVFVFGAGYDLNTDLLDRLATENGGTQDYVGEKEDIEVKVSNFYEKISKPVLAGIAVEAKGVELRDLYPRQVPDVFSGVQVLLFGRYRGEGKQTVVVRGKARDKDEVFECEGDFAGSEQNRFLPAIWAHRKVAFLMEEIRLRGHNKELEDEVVALGKRYGILTPYTSFLVVDDKMPEARQRTAEVRRGFEQEKAGANAVHFSRGLAGAKGADMAMPAGAPDMLGFGGAGGGEGVAAEPMMTTMAEKVRRVADRVFYLKEDGFYYDGDFDEKDRAKIVEVKYFSDEYFGLLGKHKEIGKYLAARLKMVLCIDGKVYRILD